VSRVGAVYFDLYGTLLDLGPLDAACEAVAPGRGGGFARAWRAEQLRLTWLRTIMDVWADFESVTADALVATARRLGVDPDGACAALDGTFDRLPVDPEAGAAIAGLRAAGLRTGILSNGSRAMLERAVAIPALATVFDDVLSVDAVRRYKPDPTVYGLAVQASGLEPGAIGFVTANDWDAAGAAVFGFRVAWLRPSGSSVPTPALGGPEPVVATWAEVRSFALDVALE
jgi:2-haloacid dehalogenase